MQNETETKPNGRQALGRGLAEIGEQNPPRIIEPRPRQATEEERTGEAIPAIIRILSDLPEAQVANVFAAVQAIKRTAGRSIGEVAHIGNELTRIERDKAQRETKAPARRGWWR